MIPLFWLYKNIFSGQISILIFNFFVISLNTFFYLHFFDRIIFKFNISNIYRDNNLLEFEVKSKIFNIRNSQVILDRDLAKFYEIKSIRLREQIKRNIERFLKYFMFQWSDLEVEFMVSQNTIHFKNTLGE